MINLLFINKNELLLQLMVVVGNTTLNDFYITHTTKGVLKINYKTLSLYTKTELNKKCFKKTTK